MSRFHHKDPSLHTRPHNPPHSADCCNDSALQTIHSSPSGLEGEDRRGETNLTAKKGYIFIMNGNTHPCYYCQVICTLINMYMCVKEP